MKISRKHPLVRFAIFFGDMDTSYDYEKRVERIDLCTLFWSCVWGVLKIAFMILVFLLVAFIAVVLPVAGIWHWVRSGIFPTGAMGASLIIWGFALGVASVFFSFVGARVGYTVWREKHPKSYAKKEPSVLVEMYKGWKQKTCVMVELERE